MSADDHVGDVDRVERRAREQVGFPGPAPMIVTFRMESPDTRAA